MFLDSIKLLKSDLKKNPMKKGRVTEMLEVTIGEVTVRARSHTRVDGKNGGGSNKASIDAYLPDYLK